MGHWIERHGAVAAELAVVILRRSGMWCFDAADRCRFASGALPVPKDASENAAIEAAHDMFPGAKRFTVNRARDR
jgi:hypothetical protein